MNQFKPFSALILSGLKAQQAIFAEAAAEPKTKAKGTCTEVTLYRCDACEEEYDYRSEAQDCCAEEEEEPDELESDDCPVCGSESYDYRAAVDCCLWKDLDAPKRWAIADAVEAGATWQDAIQQHTGQSIK